MARLYTTRQRLVIEGCQSFGVRWTHDPDEARTEATRQRNLGAGAEFGMQFGRGEAVVARMAEIQDQRALMQALRANGDARCLARRGIAAIGCDGEIRDDGFAIIEHDFDMTGCRGPACDHPLAP